MLFYWYCWYHPYAFGQFLPNFTYLLLKRNLKGILISKKKCYKDIDNSLKLKFNNVSLKCVALFCFFYNILLKVTILFLCLLLALEGYFLYNQYILKRLCWKSKYYFLDRTNIIFWSMFWVNFARTSLFFFILKKRPKINFYL